MLYFLQEKILFLPNTLPANYEYSFSAPFEEFNLHAEDGALLNALHFKTEKPRGAILYFHGNAGDLSRWGHVVSPLVEKGFDVIVMDYRTYGKSKGKLSEEVLFSDGQLFYEYAKEYYAEAQIYLYGRSLGTGIATRLASLNKPRKLLLESPYYSLIDVAEGRFPYLPVKRLLKYRMESYKYMMRVQCPVIIFHGTSDEVVPFESGERLFNSIEHLPKKLVAISGGAHNNLDQFEEYQQGIAEALQDAQPNRSEDK